MAEGKQSCFIAMPVSTSEADSALYGDGEHWTHVLETLFLPAVEAAGFLPIRPTAQGSVMIHSSIVKHLQEADLVLCDLSGHNPNVFFELGVRTSLNRPVALVRDERTAMPFDIGGINAHTYESALRSWEMDKQRLGVKNHLLETVRISEDKNPLWQAFGLTIQAEEADAAGDASARQFDLLLKELQAVKASITRTGGAAGVADPLQPTGRSVADGVRKTLHLIKSEKDVSSIAAGNELSEKASAFLTDFVTWRDDRDHPLAAAVLLDDVVQVLPSEDQWKRMPITSRRILQERADAAGVAIQVMPGFE